MSTLASGDFHDLAEELGERWNRFWFTPADPLPCSLLRIIVGLIAAAHLLDAGSGLSLWFASDGVLAPAAVRRLLELTGGEANFHVSYLTFLPAGTELVIVHGLAILVSLLFAAGLFTRISGVLTLIVVLAYVHRVPQVAGHVEPVLSFLIGYLCIAPSGASLSLDRRLFGPASKQPLLRLLIGPGD